MAAIEPAGEGKKRTLRVGTVEHFLICTVDDKGKIHFTLTGPEENRKVGTLRGPGHHVIDAVNDMLENL